MGFLYGLLTAISLFGILGGLAYGLDGSSGGYFIALFSIIGFFYFLSKTNEEKTKARDKIKDGQKEILKEKGFETEKLISVKFAGWKFAVDEKNRKFSIYLDARKAKIYNFDDMIDFKLVEDGETVTKGKTMQTIAGGLAFGVVGAIVGASGKRKNKTKIKSMYIEIEMNDLQNPRVKIPLIQFKTKKKSKKYEEIAEKAKEILSTLKYIQNNQENEGFEKTN